MPQFVAKSQPPIEAVVWDGSNEDELVDLVMRVPGIVPPDKEVTTNVVTPEEGQAWLERKEAADAKGVTLLEERPAVGLHLIVDDFTLYRPEVGEVLVYDPFRPPPHATLFVLTAEAFSIFYGEI